MSSISFPFFRALVIACVALVAGCAPESSKPARSQDNPAVVWIVVDTLRRDHLSCYGGTADTPNIDALAKIGQRFENAYTPIPITGPSHASMFTGLFPNQHGVKNNTVKLPKDLTTIAELLVSAGVQTAGAVSLGNLERRFGFDQGFQSFDDRFRRQWFRPAEEITDSALESFSAFDKDAPFFLFVHYSDPHEPYAAPTESYPKIVLEIDKTRVAELQADGQANSVPMEFPVGRSVVTIRCISDNAQFPFLFRHLKTEDPSLSIEFDKGWRPARPGMPKSYRLSELPARLSITNPGTEPKQSRLKLFVEENLNVAAMRERYAHEVEYVDAQIGRLIRELSGTRALDKTLVIVTSDHGEGLGDHNLTGHVHQLYDNLVRVPLIVCKPWHSKTSGSAPSTDLISTTDIAGTVAEHFAVDTSHTGITTSLKKPFTTNCRLLPLMTFRPEAREDLQGSVTTRFKFIFHPQEGTREFYDLVRDPGESLNLVEERMRIEREMLHLLAASDHSGASAADRIELSDEDRHQLEVLGYVH